MPYQSAARDPYAALLELMELMEVMEVMEAQCPRWPARTHFSSDASFWL